MRIEVDPTLMLRLTGYALGAQRQEFSGLGFCELEKDVVRVYDFVLLDVGSEVFTEIPASKLMALMQRPDYSKMKVWVHFHPVGNGIPGPHNWSGTDNSTITLAPLGGVPQLVRWSVSMVLTPGGWVGRIDNHLTGKTEHLEVFPSIRPAIQEIEAIKQKNDLIRYAAVSIYNHAEQLGSLEQAAARLAQLDPAGLEDLGLTPEDLAQLALDQARAYSPDDDDLGFVLLQAQDEEEIEKLGDYISHIFQVAWSSRKRSRKGKGRSKHG